MPLSSRNTFCHFSGKKFPDFIEQIFFIKAMEMVVLSVARETQLFHLIGQINFLPMPVAQMTGDKAS